MDFSLKKPCKNCPFLKASAQPKNKGWLGRERAKEVYDSMAVDDHSFPCHKTTETDDDGFESVTTRQSQHCAGALILQEKEGFANQLTRIAGRLGLYNPDNLQNRDDVVDSGDEFIAMHDNGGKR